MACAPALTRTELPLLTTSRLYLRQIRLEDAPAMFEEIEEEPKFQGSEGKLFSFALGPEGLGVHLDFSQTEGGGA